MAAVFGIHVGNTSACVAVWKDEDRVEVVANDVGDRVTPTIVQWTPNACIVGRPAQVEHFRNAASTVVRNKQLLNEDISNLELDGLKSHIPYKISKSDKCVKYELLFGGKQHDVLPHDILEVIMKKIYSIAKAAVSGCKDLNAVITVPLHFSLNSTELIKAVVKKSGFNVLQVIDEPSSAALGAGLGCSNEEPPYHCLIYRIGGVTLDATVFLVQDGMFSVVNSVYKHNLGGALLTEKLSDFLTIEFKRQFRSAQLTERGKYKLYAAAENVKQILSIQTLAQCSAESVDGGFDLNCSVSRARFENVMGPYLPEMIDPVKSVIDESCLSVDQIKKVVLCGGTLKIPKLQEVVRGIFTSAEVVTNSSSDELISLGAALQAGYCMKYQLIPDQPSINTPCLSALISIKIKIGDNEFSSTYTVPEYSALPLKKHYKVSSMENNVTVSVDLIKNGVRHLGNVGLNELEPVTFVVIDVHINKDGKLVVMLANEASTKKNCLKYDLEGYCTL